MKKCAAVLAALAALTGFSSLARADGVYVGYTIGVTLTVPAIATTLTPTPLFGTAVIRYTNATVGPAGNSLLGGFGAFTPVAGPARLVGMTFAGPLGFAVLGDTFTGFISGAAGTGPAPHLLTAGGGLGLGFAGGASGTIHCTGGTCSGLGFAASVVNPIGLALIGVLTGFPALPGPSLLPSFTLAAGTVGTFAGVPVTGTISFVEAPILGGGASRHLVPEPGTAALLGLGLVGLAAAGRRRLLR